MFYNAALKIIKFTYNRAGWPSHPASSKGLDSKSGACTSTTSSGSPGSSGVEHKVEWSESDCRLLKVRGCLSSIMDAHSRNHLHGSISGSASPRPHVSSPEGWGYMLIIPLLCLLVHVILLLHLLTLIFRRGFISPGQEVAGPELCNAVCLLAGVGHKIHQCNCHPLFHLAKIVGNPAGGNPLRLIPGGIVCQDAPFEYEAACHAKIGPFLISDPKLHCWHNCAEVNGVSAAVAILLDLRGDPWYGRTGQP